LTDELINRPQKPDEHLILLMKKCIKNERVFKQTKTGCFLNLPIFIVAVFTTVNGEGLTFLFPL